ncbi:MAG TPA: MFS transporter [Pseudonocardiaceae bacterium]|nr:MFS transporter [Pseudonocardiaceae bacterium]
MTRHRLVLLAALGIDNVGSGLFLPLTLVYATRVVGVPLGPAGALVTVSTAFGLLAPPLAGRLVDRFGPRVVVSAAQLVQAAGAAGYLVASGPATLVVAAVLLALGQQAFYSSLFALIGDTAGPGPKDRAFALVGMVRGAAFGLGGLIAAAILTSVGPAGLRVAVAADGVSFVLAATLLTVLRLPHQRHERTPATVGVLRNRPYLVLIGCAALLALALDFLLVGIPIYVLEVLHGPTWLPGVLLTCGTVVTSTAGTLVIRLTRRLARTTSIIISAVLYVVWCAVSLGAAGLPAAGRPALLLAGMSVVATATLFLTRANALAEAIAPRELRGRYLAAFQYAYTAAGIAAPGVAGLFTIGTWLPWLIVAGCAALAAAAIPYVASSLPSHDQVTSPADGHPVS